VSHRWKSSTNIKKTSNKKIFDEMEMTPETQEASKSKMLSTFDPPSLMVTDVASVDEVRRRAYGNRNDFGICV
jgi:hypothetical protein